MPLTKPPNIILQKLYNKSILEEISEKPSDLTFTVGDNTYKLEL